VSGLHNLEATLWGWHKKVKNVFSSCVWDDRRTYGGAGRNSPKKIIIIKQKKYKKENKMK